MDKLEELNNGQELIENEIKELVEKIGIQSKQKINKKDLKEVIQEYLQNYQKIDKKKKKRLNHLLFEKIIVKVDSNTDEGEVIIKIRADGQLKKKWDEIQSTNNESSNFGKIWYPGEDSNLRPTV